MTSIPPIKVDIVAGENTAVPELQRTGTEIARVAAGASSGLSPVQKLGKAMVLAEGREGSLVLRELRGAVTGLGAEAIGAAGPLGRLGLTIAEFGIGGVTGIAAVAGLALLAKGYSEITEASRLATKAQEDFAKSLASVGQGGKQLSAHIELDAARQKLAEMEATQRTATSLGNRLTGGLFTVGGFSPMQMEVQRQEIARLTIAARRADSDLADAGNKAIETITHESNALAAAVGVRQHAIDVGQDERQTLLALAEATARLHAADLHLNEQQTADLVTQATRSERLKEELTLLEQEQHLLKEISDVRWFQVIPDIHKPTLDEILGRTKHGTNVNEDAFGLFQGQQKRSALEMAEPFGKQAGGEMGKAFVEASRNSHGGLDLQRLGSESLAEIAALRSGNAGAAITSSGSLLSSLGADKAHGGLGLAGFTPAGEALSLFGSAISLFDNSAERRHKEMIAQLKKIAEKAVPEGRVVQPIYVGADAKTAGQVDYEVGRFQDRDGVYRGVGGP